MRKHVSENSLHAKACMSVQGTCLLSCFVRGQEWSVQQSPQRNRRAAEYLTPALPTTRVLEVLLKTYLSPKLKPLVFAMNNHNLTWFTLLGLLTLLRIRTASSLVAMCYLIRSAGDGSTPSPTSVACQGWGERPVHTTDSSAVPVVATRSSVLPLSSSLPTAVTGLLHPWCLQLTAVLSNSPLLLGCIHRAPCKYSNIVMPQHKGDTAGLWLPRLGFSFFASPSMTPMQQGKPKKQYTIKAVSCIFYQWGHFI